MICEQKPKPQADDERTSKEPRKDEARQQEIKEAWGRVVGHFGLGATLS